MTLQLPSRVGSELDGAAQPASPEVLFEEARRRRRRRWKLGGTLAAAAIAAAALALGTAGGGRGGGGGGGARSRPLGPGSAAGSGHASASSPSRLFTAAPASGRYYTGPGATCPLAPRSRYLPPWSGCVSTAVADISGDGRRDLILVYSRLSHLRLRGLPARTRGRRPPAARYPALRAMLRVITPAGRITTVPITYGTMASSQAATGTERVDAANLISVAHLSDAPGKTILLQTGQISSGSNALVYGLDRGRLTSAGVVLGYGGDAGSQAGFQCVAGNPPLLIQHTYDLIHGLRASGYTVHIYGWWRVTTTTYEWNGPRLTRASQATAKLRLTPRDGVGRGCTKGLA